MADNADKEVTPCFLTTDELDAIGEIMNISMGSAATAVSTMLEKQVSITTPVLEQGPFESIDSTGLEPALIVKIRYTEGIEGTNVTMLRRRDMQVILNLLMGNDVPSNDETFDFDDMSMSAACEVMNQMMGASATALSEILEMPINISTPDAILVQTKEEILESFFDLKADERVVAISFKMIIKDVLNTTFTSFLPSSLASRIVRSVSEPMDEPVPAPTMPAAPVEVPQDYTPAPTMPQMPAAAPPPDPVQTPYSPPEVIQQPVPQQPIPQQPQQQPVPQQPQQQPVPRQPMQFAAQPPQPNPLIPPSAPPAPQYAPPAGYQQAGQVPPQYAPYPSYGQAPSAYSPQPVGGYAQGSVQIKAAEFPDFSKQMQQSSAPSISNMGLLMGVHLEVSVVVGRARRKIKDILEFGPGTVVELDKQTGAPAEIMVNGKLLAYGEIIVVGDNFGIRITEIVGTKELLESLDSNL